MSIHATEPMTNRALLNSSCAPSSPNIVPSRLAENIRNILSTTEECPHTPIPSTLESHCYSFSTDSAQGKALGDVNDTKHINNFYQLISKELPTANDLQYFTKVMSQGSENSIIASNILNCTKSALALFNLLPEDKIGKVKDEAVDFYQSMLKLSNDGSKEKAANSALEKFNTVLFKQFGLTEKGMDKQDNLDTVCHQYLQESVYPDIIEKLSNVLTSDQLQALKENPEKVIQSLYPELNKRNDEKINELRKGFINHHGVNDKAAQMHFLMTALEQKTEIIARLLSDNVGPDSLPQAEQHLQTSPPAEPAVDYDMGLPASLPHTKAHFQQSPMPEPLIDYGMASPIAPPAGSFSPVFSPSINVSPIFNNNINDLLTPLAPVFNKLADALDRVTLLTERLLPGNIEPIHRADIPDMVVPVTTGQPEKITPAPPVISVPASSVEHKVNSQTNEAPPKAPVKKTTYQLNAQGGYFGTQGNALPSYRDVPVVALTNGATSGTSQSSSYRNSDTSHLAQKNASPTEFQLADVKKVKEVESTAAPKSVNALGSQFMGMGSALRSSELVELFQRHNRDSSLKDTDKTQSKLPRPVSPTNRSISYDLLTQRGVYEKVLSPIQNERLNDEFVSTVEADKVFESRAGV